jgi:hypothetical protein
MITFTAAGVDPGGTTGIVMVQVSVRDESLSVKELALQSLREARDVILLAHRHKPKIAFVEKRATYSSSLAGIRPYEAILAGLSTLGYLPVRDFDITNRRNQVMLYSPAIWKPFMKMRDVDFRNMHPTTDHEKDAMELLHYGLMVHFPGKEIHYE